MTPLVTFVTACADYHAAVLPRALASVKAQTVPCEHVVIHDTLGNGAGWARNQGLAQVNTPFVVFLDADDTVAPDFAAKTLAAWTPGHYVYTGWREDTITKPAPTEPWILKPVPGKPRTLEAAWHVITTLIPAYAVRFVGGFDETVHGLEDTILWWALTRRGMCGIPVDEPLFYYGSEGRRARAFVNSPAYEPTMDALVKEYEGMGCCGGEPVLQPPSNEPLPGDVLVIATWAGNRVEVGPVTGRSYPRTGNGKQVYVNPADAQARPDLWRPVEQTLNRIERIPVIDVLQSDPLPALGVANGLHEVAQKLFPGRVLDAPLSVDAMRAMQPVGRPDFGQVVKLAGGQ